MNSNPDHPKRRLPSDPVPAECLEFFFDHFPDPILIWSLDGTHVRPNRAAARLMGYDGENLPQTLFEDPFKFMASEVADRLPDILREEQMKGEISLVVPIHCRNGSILRAEVRSRLVRIDGQGYRCMVLRDVETMQAAEDARRAANSPLNISDILPDIFNEPELMFEMDAHGFFTSASSLALEKTGYTMDELRKGVHFAEIILPDDRERARLDFEKVLRCERIDALEYSVLRKDGATFPVMLSLSRIQSGGVPRGLRGIALDISEHKRVERDLMIREKLNTLGEMSGGVVHNFNNILSVILGYLDLLPMENADEQCHKILRGIRQAAQDGAEIVKRIQNFTRMQVVSAPGEPADFRGIVRDALGFLNSRIYGSSPAVEMVEHLDATPPVSAVPSEIREVLINILNNALDAMPEGGTLTVRTGVIDGMAAACITDTGTGMSEETRHRLFEPFFTTKREKGTGMGMSVSYAIVSKFKGEIRVKSREGEGSAITVLLPSAVTGETKAPVNREASKPDGRSILVLDDEENICDILQEFLSREGHEVVTARRGEAGLSLLETREFDVLITDLNMPGVSGWDLACQVREQRPGTLIVMLTGWGTRVEQLNRRKPVVDRILHKPIDFPLLSRIVSGAEK